MPGVQASPSQRQKGSPTGVEGLETLQPGSPWVTETGQGKGHVWVGDTDPEGDRGRQEAPFCSGASSLGSSWGPTYTLAGTSVTSGRSEEAQQPVSARLVEGHHPRLVTCWILWPRPHGQMPPGACWDRPGLPTARSACPEESWRVRPTQLSRRCLET